MKVKIIIKKEEEKEYTDDLGNKKKFTAKSLFVSHDSEAIYNSMRENLKAKGADQKRIDSFSKPYEKDGKTTYGFNLKVSSYTFDRVERFGVLDAKIELSVNKSGYCDAKVAIIDKKEQILGYDKPQFNDDSENVDGWATDAPEPTTAKIEPSITPLSELAAGGDSQNDLPF